MRRARGPLIPSGNPPGARLRPAVAAVVLALAACAPVGNVGPGDGGQGALPVPAVVDAPPIRDGLRTEPEAREVARLLADGEAEFAAGRFAEALERAREVELGFPEAAGSGAALWLSARARAELEEWEEAADQAERYVRLFDPASNRPPPPPALLLLAEAMWRSGAPGAVPVLFEVPPTAPPETLQEVGALATAIARATDTAALRELLSDVSGRPAIVSAFMVELAVRRYLLGDEGEARTLAGDALALAPPRPVADRALRVLEGRVDEELGLRPVLGAIVPGSGSPALQQLTREIQEGIEVALLAEADLGFVPPEVVYLQDDGDPARAGAAVRTLEEREAVGAVGPLLDPLVDSAARARQGALPIVSPTAESLPADLSGVLSLVGPDPEAAHALGRLVLEAGVLDVVVLHAATQEMYREAAWFREAYEAGGGRIRRSFTYPAGTTGFGAHFDELVRMRPRGLVMILPPGESDIEVLAPQLAFYDVRTRVEGMALFGNEAWTFPASLDYIQPQHTNGVLSVTSWPDRASFGPEWNAFVERYEDHFQRTLRSSTPALVYDAARLLLAAARSGGGHASGTDRALGEIRDFPGATGILSVQDGRIVRRFFPVRIENRRLVEFAP